jgi:glutamyl-tRNA synthetase
VNRTGRYAPSPTADLHLGNLRTALLAWLFARSAGSSFRVRIEDLDRERSRAGFEQTQLRDLRAIGVDWDGDVVRQSERDDLYEAALDRLETYECWCTRAEIREAVAAPHSESSGGAYPGTCRDLSERQRRERRRSGRPPAIRVHAASATIQFKDRVRGSQRDDVDDFVVRRNDGAYAYNLAVVVDDGAQDVGEIVRGDDLLSSTTRQIWLGEQLGLSRLSYAHVPLVLASDGQRLAKRHGAVTLSDRIALGDSPDQVRSVLAASVGICEPGDQPTPQELVSRFDPDSLELPRSGPLLSA